MLFHVFRHHPSTSESPLPSGAGELERSDLADEAEAFLNGRLAERRATAGSPLAAWMIINRICHGDPVDIYGLAADDVARGPLTRGSSSRRSVWTAAQCSMATRLLARALDPDEIRQVQRDVLIPLELRLIALTRDEPLTFARVVSETIDALDNQARG